MLSSLLNYLENITPLSEQLRSRLEQIIQTKTFAKKELLLKEGEVSNFIFFIEQGFARSFYTKEGKDITAWFMAENDVIISVASFFTRIKSYENIEALEDMIVHYINYNELEKLYNDFPEFNKTGRLLTTHYYVLSEERVYNMRRQTAEERYHFMLEKYPQLILRAQLSHIASYLGLTIETLSRVRSRK